VLFFSRIERSVLMALVFYYKNMLEKVTMQRTQQFSAFSLLPKEPSQMQRMRCKSAAEIEPRDSKEMTT